ncbi:nuclear transport factor 2 family protein [Fibrella aquatilis]|uniref:Nuclear transport factor 2 family protein n=1 Tax=Fibrella aquatilis TaxID=2817059 RepID=A0A939G2A2_9BACT|nr:nuclear transport factor 2 family protein [Fibrella aquatilis]MBO0931017.1 nuclear transport factor 2 family protein [Fibrella aquatilis]
MKKTLFLLSTLLTTTLAVAQTAAPAANEPTGLATAFMKAMETEDGAAIAAITTDDFAIVSFDGQVADRDLLGQGLSGGFLVIETAPANNLRSRTYNSDLAIVTGDSKFKGSLQGTNFNTNVVFTATCVKTGSGWKIASVQFSGGTQ